MQQMNRILAVCNEYERCDEVIETVAKLAKEHGAGVTLIYVHEVSLFELPLFHSEEGLDHEKLYRELKERASKKVKKESWVKQEVVKAVFEELWKMIVEKVRDGEVVRIKEFGKFYAVERKPRPKFFPKTGERIGTIGKRKEFVFRPSRKIKILKEE